LAAGPRLRAAGHSSAQSTSPRCIRRRLSTAVPHEVRPAVLGRTRPRPSSRPAPSAPSVSLGAGPAPARAATALRWVPPRPAPPVSPRAGAPPSSAWTPLRRGPLGAGTAPSSASTVPRPGSLRVPPPVPRRAGCAPTALRRGPLERRAAPPVARRAGAPPSSAPAALRRGPLRVAPPGARQAGAAARLPPRRALPSSAAGGRAVLRTRARSPAVVRTVAVSLLWATRGRGLAVGGLALSPRLSVRFLRRRHRGSSSRLALLVALDPGQLLWGDGHEPLRKLVSVSGLHVLHQEGRGLKHLATQRAPLQLPGSGAALLSEQVPEGGRFRN